MDESAAIKKVDSTTLLRRTEHFTLAFFRRDDIRLGDGLSVPVDCAGHKAVMSLTIAGVTKLKPAVAAFIFCFDSDQTNTLEESVFGGFTVILVSRQASEQEQFVNWLPLAYQVHRHHIVGTGGIKPFPFETSEFAGILIPNALVCDRMEINAMQLDVVVTPLHEYLRNVSS